MLIKDSLFFSSWSGGKDSGLALYQAIKEGGKPSFLLTMLTEDGRRSRSHGLEVGLIKEQAVCLGIPLVFYSASWQDYESVFTSAISKFKKQGIKIGVFGDIDIEPNRAWVKRVCSSASVCAYHPLWQEKRSALLKQLLELGFKARIIALKDGVLDKRFLGKILDSKLVDEMNDIGVDACGENGEYHTVITDGPIFSRPLDLNIKNKVLRDGYWFLDVSLDKKNSLAKKT